MGHPFVENNGFCERMSHVASTGVKQRYYPMRGFGSVASAAHFCRAFDEVRQFFRVSTTMKQSVPLAHQREVLRYQLDALKAMVLVA